MLWRVHSDPHHQQCARELSAIIIGHEQANKLPDPKYVNRECGNGKHHWHENADAEGDTCNCGEWYRFADRIEASRP
jgi:hypothetical protein